MHFWALVGEAQGRAQGSGFSPHLPVVLFWDWGGGGAGNTGSQWEGVAQITAGPGGRGELKTKPNKQAAGGGQGGGDDVRDTFVTRAGTRGGRSQRQGGVRRLTGWEPGTGRGVRPLVSRRWRPCPTWLSGPATNVEPPPRGRREGVRGKGRSRRHNRERPLVPALGMVTSRLPLSFVFPPPSAAGHTCSGDGDDSLSGARRARHSEAGVARRARGRAHPEGR